MIFLNLYEKGETVEKNSSVDDFSVGTWPVMRLQQAGEAGRVRGMRSIDNRNYGWGQNYIGKYGYPFQQNGAYYLCGL